MNDEKVVEQRLEKGFASTDFITNPNIGNTNFSFFNTEGFSSYGDSEYFNICRESRFFYKNDSIAGPVINRVVEMASKGIVNKRGFCDGKELAYFNSLIPQLNRIIESAFLEYLLSGYAVIDFTTTREMGNRYHPDLGRTRFYFPTNLWVRNPNHLRLKKEPFGDKRYVILSIPEKEREFLKNKGVLSDGYKNKELYRTIMQNYPEYVKAVQNNRYLHLDIPPILRKPLSDSDYPTPYLSNALSALRHKLRVKQMDYVLATRAMEIVRHITVGDKDFPATEDDSYIEEIQQLINSRTAYNGNDVADRIYTLFTNHTVDITWSVPPLDALLSSAKYEAPNEDIFLGLGFPRLLLVGETFKSNSGQSITSTVGPLSTLFSMQRSVSDWIVSYFYPYLANLNGFKNIPTPTFLPIHTADVISLIELALNAVKQGAVSRDYLANLFGTSFDEELEKIQEEGYHLAEDIVENTETVPVKEEENLSQEENVKTTSSRRRKKR